MLIRKTLRLRYVGPMHKDQTYYLTYVFNEGTKIAIRNGDIKVWSNPRKKIFRIPIPFTRTLIFSGNTQNFNVESTEHFGR